MNDFTLILRSTSKLYVSALVAAGKGLSANWQIPFLHFVVVLLLSFLLPLLSIFGQVIGGFIAGLLIALILSGFLVTVGAAAQGETFKLSELKEQSIEQFWSVLSALFTLYILLTLAQMALSRPEQEWLLQSLHLVVTVLFNPLPEVVVYRRGGATDSFSASFEFVKENFFEWFIPFFLLLLPLFFVSFEYFFAVSLIVFTKDPMHLIQEIILSFSNREFLFSSTALSILILYAVYFVFIFRAVLFEKLYTSSRRKRLYTERMGA